MNHFPILFHLNKFTLLTTFSSCSVERWPLKMHLLIKNQVLASRKNIISSAISTLLTYTGFYRLNGHDFVYFIFCYAFFFYIFYEEMQKLQQCRPYSLYFSTHYYMGILNSKPIFFRFLNHMAILAEPLLSSHLS